MTDPKRKDCKHLKAARVAKSNILWCPDCLKPVFKDFDTTAQRPTKTPEIFGKGPVL